VFLAEIVVTGRALPEPAGAQAYAARTLDADALVAEASGRPENALRGVAGFQQFRRTDSRAANPTSQGVTFRGLGGNAASRAVVTLDGVPLADPFGGWIAWSAVPPLEAARVTRGGGAGAFGSGAVAGAVELFGAGPEPGLDAAYGSRDALRLAATAGDGISGLFGRYERGDGYVLLSPAQRGTVDVPARYRQWAAGGRAAFAAGDGEVQTRAVLFGDERLRGLPGTESRTDGADASLGYVTRGDWSLSALGYVQLRRFESGFASADAARRVATPTLDQYNTPATGIGGKIELRPPVGAAHDVQIGVDVRRASGVTRERFRFQGGAFTRLREAGGRSVVAGAFVEDGWRASEALTLTGGVRLDRWTLTNGRLDEREIGTGAPVTALAFADRSGWEPTARGGAVLALTPALKARGAAYLGWRLPTLNELYRPFRLGLDATAANPALRPERSRGVEVGLDYAPLSTARAGVTLFDNRLENAVGNATLGRGPGTFPQVGFVAAGGTFRQRANLDAIRSRGVEADAALAIGPWALEASYAYVDARVRPGRLRPAQTPVHSGAASLRYAAAFDAALTARYASAQFEDDLNVRRLAPALTFDATARVPLGRGLALTAAAENLFDRTVEAGVSEAGIVDRGTPRTVWFGIAWKAD
jgi:outer membrane receptor protein involved in Fe transport